MTNVQDMINNHYFHWTYLNSYLNEGCGNMDRKSMDEESTSRENPDGYQLACVTFAYGDITVEMLPPIQNAQ